MNGRVIKLESLLLEYRHRIVKYTCTVLQSSKLRMEKNPDVIREDPAVQQDRIQPRSKTFNLFLEVTF